MLAKKKYRLIRKAVLYFLQMYGSVPASYLLWSSFLQPISVSFPLRRFSRRGLVTPSYLMY